MGRLLTGLVHTPIDAPSYEPRDLLVSWVGTVSEKAYARPDLAYEETNVYARPGSEVSGTRRKVLKSHG